MKLLTLLGVAVAAWGITAALQNSDRRWRERHREALTRWEGEGGAIPAVKEQEGMGVASQFEPGPAT